MVRPRLRVAILSTGSELAEPGMPLAPGQIWNANRSLLAGLLTDPWVSLTDLGALPDTPDRLTDALLQGAATADLVVTTGGVSVGDEDHMPGLVCRAGGRIHVRDVAMKPGKPVTIGTLGPAIWLGLPGNPVAAFVTWTVLGAPLARAMAGLTAIAPRKSVVRLAADVEHKRGRCDYRLARRLGHDAQGVEVVACLTGAGSHRSALLAEAEGLALIPADADGMAAGDLVQFLPF
jgi:molybdopterin molybdotransferase